MYTLHVDAHRTNDECIRFDFGFRPFRKHRRLDFVAERIITISFVQSVACATGCRVLRDPWKCCDRNLRRIRGKHIHQRDRFGTISNYRSKSCPCLTVPTLRSARCTRDTIVETDDRVSRAQCKGGALAKARGRGTGGVAGVNGARRVAIRTSSLCPTLERFPLKVDVFRQRVRVAGLEIGIFQMARTIITARQPDHLTTDFVYKIAKCVDGSYRNFKNYGLNYCTALKRTVHGF